MWRYISWWQIVNLGTLYCIIVTEWCRWCSRRRGHQCRCVLSALIGWMCTSTFVPPVCLWINCYAMLPRKEAVCVVFMKHSWVFCYSSFHLVVHRIRNALFLLFSDSARGVFIRCCVSSIAAPENPPLAIFAICNPMHMSDCCNCTQPLCLAIVADMLKIYKKLIGSEDEIPRLPLPYGVPLHLLRWIMPVASFPGDAEQEIGLRKSQSLQHWDI